MTTRERGRPAVSSLAALEDAANELFLERGFDGATIDDIAKRAGISRATFFNYCQSKSDLLWLAVDDALGRLEELLRDTPHLGEALRSIARAQPAERIPLSATQRDAMGAEAEFAGSAGRRIERLRQALLSSGVDPDDAWLVLGALVSALQEWTMQSPRGVLVDILEKHLGRIRGVLGAHTLATLF